LFKTKFSANIKVGISSRDRNSIIYNTVQSNSMKALKLYHIKNKGKKHNTQFKDNFISGNTQYAPHFQRNTPLLLPEFWENGAVTRKQCLILKCMFLY